ncbi:PAS domain S-box protein [Candidatus Methylomicrobium oryzae]|uniref:PAS domain S-box protein n=1 Tax=Candidatus Methylomicrobium oryzae TaxID=2802053 RepID=UPI00192067FD|nr:PAS domain S-box protein [Methylomicrobium sp. RS1]MBL1263910.1 PAS domain S-box protein [Methylomicrobium sp. RS1]
MLSGILAVQSTPLITREGRVIGMISTHWRQPHTPSERDFALLDVLARQVTDVLERRRALDVLRQNEERLRRMLEIETVGVIFFDQTGTVIDANESFLNLTGYTRQDIETRALTWRHMTPPEYMDESEAQLESLDKTGKIGPYEKEYFCKDGTRRWLLFAGRDLGDGTISEFCIDVTDKKRTETALRAAEKT